jgi:hypothetical protein
MYKIFRIVFCVIVLATSQCLWANEIDSLQKKVLLTEVSLGENISSVSARKIEIAFATACLLSKKYEAVFPKEVIQQLQEKQLPSSSITEIKQGLTAIQIDYVAQLKILRLGNVLRITLLLDNVLDTIPSQSGIGYSLLTYRIANSKDSILYDVALLEGIQRALAVTTKEPKLFADLEGKFQVIPTSTLIVGGIAFFGNDSFPKWDLFKEKTAVSYDAVTSMFLELKDNKNFTTYDIDSRDSLFAMFHLYGLENYQAPTVQEIKAMYTNEVTHYITGTLVRTATGADLDLYLCYVNGKTAKLNAMFKSSSKIKNDSKIEFKEKLLSTLKDLMTQYPSILEPMKKKQ